MRKTRHENILIFNKITLTAHKTLFPVSSSIKLQNLTECKNNWGITKKEVFNVHIIKNSTYNPIFLPLHSSSCGERAKSLFSTVSINIFAFPVQNNLIFHVVSFIKFFDGHAFVKKSNCESLSRDNSKIYISFVHKSLEDVEKREIYDSLNF